MLLPNRQGFSNDLYRRLKPRILKPDDKDDVVTCENLAEKKGDLFPHQKFVSEFINDSPYRGLLLYHGLGSGKTIAAAAAATQFLEGNGRRVSIWTPASLSRNFRDTMISLKVPPNSTKVEYINYNGLTAAKVREKYVKNYFDDKLVIIDEAHNWISRCVHMSSIAKIMYDRLFFANNVKILLLSATPMINSPNELAFMMNLLRGPITAYTFAIPSYEEDMLQPVKKYIDEQSFKGGLLKLTLVPIGFVKSGDGGVTNYMKRETLDHADIIKQIEGVLNVKGTSKWHTALPFDKADFDRWFISPNYSTVVNDDLFIRRITGLVSFIKNSNPELYPKLVDDKTHVEELKMSPEQTKAYVVVRTHEYQKEARAKKMKRFQTQDPFNKTAQVYRAFSRATCNFAFPNDIKRMYPNNLREIAREMDFSEEGKNEEEKTENGEKAGEKAEKAGEKTATDKADIDKQYAAHLNDLLKKIDAPQYLSVANIRSYSVKFAAIINKMLESPRELHLIYTQFRKIEGIGLLSLALKQNGYTEIKLIRHKGQKYSVKIESGGVGKKRFIVYPADDKRAAQIALDIYNSELDKLPDDIREDIVKSIGSTNARAEICQALLITQGGAEGITLKNCRQVHILEPYWNQIRHDQVLGRAIRTCSHVGLSPAERTVKAFIYIAKMDMEVLANKDFTVTKQDGGTTDEHIMAITIRKATIMNRFLSLMQTAAADCLLFNKGCYAYPLNLDPLTEAYKADIKDDDPDVITRVRRRIKSWTGQTILHNGKKYVLNPVTKQVFDYRAYKRAHALVPVTLEE